MELKYNTQLDAAKIKADADLEKLVTSNRNKTFLAAQASSDRLDQQVSNLDGQQRTSDKLHQELNQANKAKHYLKILY